ncbi:hypothetical protein [Streptomyces griseosporeus]|uniref:hypothetical protein n=1 Tax=Streptomyces griseosporeus TaxID=1910 RepID=UPI0036F7AAF3
MSAPTTHQTTPDDVAALMLPEPVGLTEDQLRGAACVWCGERLTIETAIDLGEHTAQSGANSRDLGGRWYPRSCRPCVYHAALGHLHAHALGCAGCREGDEAGGHCEKGRALARLMREFAL